MTKNVLQAAMSNENNFENQIKEIGFRKKLAYESHLWFFNMYFSDYVQYETAPMQKEMFLLTEDESIKTAVVIAFRSSGKSTIFTTSFPIWSILGKPQKKFIMILSQNQNQARAHLANIRREFEGNDLLKADLGPFKEESDEWSAGSLVLPKHNAKITVASSEQSIRGLRHGFSRPDIIIVDDAEDSASVKTKEGRDKTYNWLTSEVIPCGDKNTRYIIIGNLLHEDSLLMRLKKDIDEGKRDGVFKYYPLIDDHDRILWQGKFPTMADVEVERRKVGNEIAWQREYLLRIVADEDQVITRDMLHFYSKLPSKNQYSYRDTAMSVDLAIKLGQNNDFTAIISAQIHGWSENLRVYILPNLVNRRMNFTDTVDCVEQVSRTLGEPYSTVVYVEDVGYQSALIESLKSRHLIVEAVKVTGDKYLRLSVAATWIKSGNILFPKTGCEELIRQITHFGIEKHDDLSDALAQLINKATEPKPESEGPCGPIMMMGVSPHDGKVSRYYNSSMTKKEMQAHKDELNRNRRVEGGTAYGQFF